MIATLTMRTIPEGNARERWQGRHRRRKGQRNTAALLVRHALRAEPVEGPWLVTMTRVAPSRGLDAHDGLPMSLKAVVDGVADALGIDDADPRVTWAYAQKRGAYAVIVSIEART